MTEHTASEFVAARLGLLPWEPPVPKRGSRYGAAARCWLCGGATAGVGWPRATAIAPTFTNHNLAAVPTSDAVCQACVATSSGETWRAYAARRPELGLKTAHPLSWRSYSHAVATALPGGHTCPFRGGWRDILLSPPEPPFVFVVAMSGQKHLLFRARVAHSRDVFFVQVEEDMVIIIRSEFAACLAACEALLVLGLARDAILTGRYPQGSLGKLPIAAWRTAEAAWAPWRRRPDLARLACYVGHRPQEDA